ncbi:MAG: hypothetical protein ABI164_00265, partial [Acidobacteriaceae bacterium]
MVFSNRAFTAGRAFAPAGRPAGAFRQKAGWPVTGLAIALCCAIALLLSSGFACLAQTHSAATHRKHSTTQHNRHTHAKSSAHEHSHARHRTVSPSHARPSHAHHGHARAARATSRHHKRRRPSARTLARVHQLRHAFVESSELRPMAQQLITARTPQAYAGVLHYARAHSGEASAAAYMALGQAYLEDGKFPDAATAFQQANRAGQALDDYADYLGAKADFSRQQYVPAQQLLQGFAERHADSILIGRATLLLAEVKLNQGDPQSALQELAKLHDGTLAHSAEYLFTLAHSNELAGNRNVAQQQYVRIYVDFPTSSEAGQVGNQLHQMGVTTPFTVAQSIRHADGLYLAGRYAGAAGSYQALAQDPRVSGTAQVNDLLARAAVASFKQTHHVDLSQLAHLSDTNDDAGATRLYLSVEAARDRKDAAQVKALTGQMEQRFPSSRW